SWLVPFGAWRAPYKGAVPAAVARGVQSNAKMGDLVVARRVPERVWVMNCSGLELLHGFSLPSEHSTCVLLSVERISPAWALAGSLATRAVSSKPQRFCAGSLTRTWMCSFTPDV